MSVLWQVIEFDDGAGSVLRIQPLRVQRDEAIYECTATNSLGEINTSAKLSVLEGVCRGAAWRVGRGARGESLSASPGPVRGWCVFGRKENWPSWRRQRSDVDGDGHWIWPGLLSVCLVSLHPPAEPWHCSVGSEV